MKLLFISAAINEKWNHLDGLFSVLAVLYTCVFLFVIVDLFFGVRRARQLKIIRTLRLPRRLCHPCNLSFARVQHHRKNHNPLGTSCRKQHGTLHCKRRKMVGHPRNKALTAADGAAYQRIVAAMSRVENGIPADTRQVEAGFALRHQLSHTPQNSF